MKQRQVQDWSGEDAAELYGIRNWGAGYFDLNEAGEITVRVETASGEIRSVSLMDIARGATERGLGLPLLLRIENLLDAQIARINQSFARAIESCGYGNVFRGVFPIKVNQQCQVIEEIAKAGRRFNHGLEAGSKAELIAALSILDNTESLIICNGYKDEEFINLGLQAQRLGVQIFFVVETPSEVDTIIRCAEREQVRPNIGVRVKLASKVGGYWNATSGDRSIFGLGSNDLIAMVDQLRHHDMLDCLKLLHYHLGSQVPNIRDIRTGVLEACRYYADLVEEGAAMGYLDLGGGLAVDYDGSKTNYTHSKNYSLDEYCVDVVEAIMGTLDSEGVAHPVIITESGRATVAYSSVLLFDILDTTRFEPVELEQTALSDGDHPMLMNLLDAVNNITPKNLQESYNDALYYRDEVRALYLHGQVSLRERASAENLFLQGAQKIRALLDEVDEVPVDLQALPEVLSDIYYANMSVFQSLPDMWAIDQVFPLVPIHRLNEAPTRSAIIADITCDCDGKIDRFIGRQKEHKTLPVHALKESEDYILGTFLIGAYQETLGDLHNLFGDTNVVSVRIHDDGSFDYSREIHGDSIADVLSYVEYQPQALFESFRKLAEKAVKSGKITPQQRKQILHTYTASMSGYTYFEK
ncbi:biosynthetic arginine decarboxylase [Microbulbifer thermotolerans]|uniref:Arginine decarboxylase n=1 Tax=Microbulbifer thermotolerans TaxID=252514 RepID=A0A143HJH2_MICTH|nr:biosynthetic arginine decarboxylase [Microbulbifer thermotolerans]AMX01422.1 arginine decarboxylase [Microbulbifer thermotolerans]MCX2778258.1 biosynthetic arginine decarboxylase [Microbulbifer thermotolerans]MCX2782019.1 biosynthetic arginine decarboxylase [Microbulbifer thermotolerans]MCX2783223.1 biosynthetic arginine decarboxylase [Microbulbifer thermotolerans]MCX2795592.1 biosynthetic arginine decarboxylase [Microbulbifer thermotolerans]